ncbi:MAG TPA: RNA polymerase sigma-70 factor [Puia sp.]|nr:RNA polymerase sigma-70 factor [Puia sp.]
MVAFSALLDMYWARVYGHTLAYTKSPALAEELTQDVFMDVWNSRDRLLSVENFSNYLFIIARNRVFKALRKRLEALKPIEDLHIAEDLWLPDRQAEYREMHTVLLKGMALLPPVRQKVFAMSRMDGKSYDQIAAELNISRNTVKEHIVKALNFLRDYLARHNLGLLLVFLWLF